MRDWIDFARDQVHVEESTVRPIKPSLTSQFWKMLCCIRENTYLPSVSMPEMQRYVIADRLEGLVE